MSDFGAEVIKIEPPEGDMWRQANSTPPYPISKELKFKGAFDDQFSEYHHLIDEVWAGPELVEFAGNEEGIGDGQLGIGWLKRRR